MEDQTAILSGSLQADPFETQMRGYHRRQVEDYIARAKEQVRREAAARDQLKKLFGD